MAATGGKSSLVRGGLYLTPAKSPGFFRGRAAEVRGRANRLAFEFFRLRVVRGTRAGAQAVAPARIRIAGGGAVRGKEGCVQCRRLGGPDCARSTSSAPVCRTSADG
jgi:hypothetical protein